MPATAPQAADELETLDRLTLAVDALDEQVDSTFDAVEGRAKRVELAHVVREIRAQRERLRDERGEQQLNARAFAPHEQKERARAAWGADFERLEAELQAEFEGVTL